MQLLYQFDVRGESDAESIRHGMHEGSDPSELWEESLVLATAAWSTHGDGDAIVARLAPEWPTHRQPPVDRAILRLAYHEMVSDHAPVKVAISEAVELAKQFGAEQSPAFINGVLDKMARLIALERRKSAEPEDDDAARAESNNAGSSSSDGC